MPRDKGTTMACEQPFSSLRKLALSLPVVLIKIESTMTSIYLKASDADEGILSVEVMQMRCTIRTHFYLLISLSSSGSDPGRSAWWRGMVAECGSRHQVSR
jgi:hypothetical protein